MEIKNIDKIALGHGGEKNELKRPAQNKVRDEMYDIIQDALDKAGITTVKVDKTGLVFRGDACDVEIKAIVKQSRVDIEGIVYEMEMAEKERKRKEKEKEKKIAKDIKIRKMKKEKANKDK